MCQYRSYRNFSHKNIIISDEIQHAISNHLPIVALESTIISHGMPYPKNIEIAHKIENTVRINGAIPATIAIINGIPKVGLSSDDLMILGDNSRSQVMKASTRDIAYAISHNLTAATTVASTMKIANTVNIKVFATGGIGGVHRGVETTLDISADLIELGRTPVTVVCAGIKSILDIKKTLEYLETQGVPVIGYKTHDFPAFFTNNSSIKSPLTVNDSYTIANMMLHAEMMQLQHGKRSINHIDSILSSYHHRNGRRSSKPITSERDGHSVSDHSSIT